MFDILVYLFETYTVMEQFPASAVLVRKLSAVGFEQAEISAALSWLNKLEKRVVDPGLRAASSLSMRLLDGREQARLPLECRSFLLFLENAQAIDSRLREVILEQALLLSDETISLAKLKIITLMVLWRHQPQIDAINSLLLEELLVADESQLPVH